MTRPPIALALFAPLAFAAACAAPADGPSLEGPDGPEASALAAAEGAAPPPSFEATPPVPHAGEYRFQGRVVPLARLTVDVVNMLMQGSAERLARLQAAGATCQLVLSNTYRCKKMHGPEAVPASSLAALGAQDAGV
ncbi:MAG TPA: hypothetical protein VFS00_16125, partial [Polyangiaceae bacterium]|nr:hypothetical protein [Polyangiaceae bacterium]